MQMNWFKRSGFLFLPKSIMGWMILFAGICFAVFIFIRLDRHSHSASDTLRPFFIDLIFIVIVYELIAFFTSKQNKS
jgi:putative effector of murein hydrolase LrgA (UPF0299 family)